MDKNQSNGCAEFHRLSRRSFLTGAASLATLAGLPAWMPNMVFAQNGRRTRDVMVNIFLNGGADPLTLCVPHGENEYYRVRSTIAIPRPDSGDPMHTIDLDGFFGLPPALQELYEAYQAGHLLIVQATGSNDPTRSHFDAMRYMEVGKPGDLSINTGWLARHLMTVPPAPSTSVLRGLDFAGGLHQTLLGAPLTVAASNPASYDLSAHPNWKPRWEAWMRNAYERIGGEVPTAAVNTLNTIALLRGIDFAGYRPQGGAVYPGHPVGAALKAAATLIKADVGVEALYLNYTGDGFWDSHSNQQPNNFQGGMGAAMRVLSTALAAFHTDIFSGTWTNVTVVVMSEFGRNVRENGSRGTDHGHGGVMFVMGEHIAGGRVLTDWPGLQPEQLYAGQDLQVTIDYRDILAEIVQNRLENPNLDLVFPGFTPTFRGVTN